MIVIPISNKTILVRHWFKWYRVMRGGADWHQLNVEKRAAPRSIAKIASSLASKQGSALLPEILDEKKADREVNKKIKKHS